MFRFAIAVGMVAWFAVPVIYTEVSILHQLAATLDSAARIIAGY